MIAKVKPSCLTLNMCKSDSFAFYFFWFNPGAVSLPILKALVTLKYSKISQQRSSPSFSSRRCFHWMSWIQPRFLMFQQICSWSRMEAHKDLSAPPVRKLNLSVPPVRPAGTRRTPRQEVKVDLPHKTTQSLSLCICPPSAEDHSVSGLSLRRLPGGCQPFRVIKIIKKTVKIIS